MVKCTCINDKDRPSKIPQEKWLKKGQEYTIIFTSMVLPQKTLAVQLDEIDLDESCAPYKFFLADRFAFSRDELDKLIAFIKECNQISISIKDLLKQTNERTADTVKEN